MAQVADSEAQIEPADPAGAILVVVLAYAFCGGLWIFGSDWLLAQLIRDASLSAQISSYKGWAFIAITSLLLLRVLRKVQRAGRAPAWSATGSGATVPKLPLLATVGIIGLATAGVARLDYTSRWQQEAEQIEAVAALRAAEVGSWLSERQAQAHYVARSKHFEDLVNLWEQTRDAQALERLQIRLQVADDNYLDRSATTILSG